MQKRMRPAFLLSAAAASLPLLICCPRAQNQPNTHTEKREETTRLGRDSEKEEIKIDRCVCVNKRNRRSRECVSGLSLKIPTKTAVLGAGQGRLTVVNMGKYKR